MLKAFANCWKIPELRRRILFTFGVVALCRVAANINVPRIDPDALSQLFKQLEESSQGAAGVVGMFNMFSGGALQRFAVGALGIMPYISASIIMQLMTPVVPQLEKLKREGESGQQKLTQWTRYLTLLICVVQGWMLAKGMENPAGILPGLPANIKPVVVDPGLGFELTTMIILTAGTMLLMWMGEQITDRGIGNGASLIITIGIIEQLPQALYIIWDLWMSEGSGEQQFTLIHLMLLFGVFAVVTAATVHLTLGQRKVPLQYARAARKGGAGTSQQGAHIPLRVNFANVMPIIFASAILMFPPMILDWAMQWESVRSWDTLSKVLGVSRQIFEVGSTGYLAIYALMLILFAFFWVANQFNPIQISDDLKRQGAYIPGVRPGKPTADFLDKTMTRVTMIGALYLTALALLPLLFNSQLGINFLVAGYFGGASLLIIVGVLLDTMRQIESHLLMHHYDGFLQKGHLRGRRGAAHRGGVGIPT